MAEVQNRVADYLDHPDDNTRRFHLGDAPQAMPPIDEATEEEELTLKQHRAAIHAPTARPRFRNADGEPIETSPLGLVFDEESGGLLPTDENGEVVRPTAGETRRSTRRAARASAGSSDMPDEADTDDEDEDEADKDKPSRTRPTPAPTPQPAPAPTSTSRPTGSR